MYDFKTIESKWQNRWENDEHFKAIDFHPTKPKYYVLYEFYNISGNLHIGHLKGTVPADALARMKRMQGYNVLFPIGGDAFGLPAENAAIKYGIDPKDFVENGMKNVINQSKKLGLSFDYDRTIVTSDEDYYKWTQWIFLQLFKNDKAYKEKGIVNYCPNCKTVLSNEDSQDGICDRCHGKVVQEERNVWYLKMKEYADKLLKNVDNIQMNDNLKKLQRNWIGKTEGYQISFDINDENNNLITKKKIFTSNIENIYGTTYLVVAPENELLSNENYIKNYNEILEYRMKTSHRSQFDRISNQKYITGIKIEGLYAINPVTKERISIYTSDYVINNNEGIVMGVPGRNKFDFDFASKYNIFIKEFIDNDILINSNELNGLKISEVKKIIEEKLIKSGVANKYFEYKMQDWPFNRQRYWGEPFPIVFCDNCGTVPIDENDLPVRLPYTKDFLPGSDGNSPLSKIEEWVNCTCPKCGRKAKRETDTMPNWAGSSWYWIRYCDPHNKNEIANFDKLKYWGSVDCYTGGTEHITRHVLYAFFWQNFLYEIGAVPIRDPFVKKMGSGLILDDTGKKMSKSSTNGVSPLEVIEKYGVDAARLHVHFLGSYEDNTSWTYNGMNGITNFLNKVWDLPNLLNGEQISENHMKITKDLIKKVSEDIESLKLNTAIASCMSYVKKIREDGYITKEELNDFLLMLNPLAPHITSEIYEKVFNKNILDAKWPDYNKILQSNIVNVVVSVNNKKKFVLKLSSGNTENMILEYLSTNTNIFDNNEIDKVFYVQDKIINIITKKPMTKILKKN